MTPYELADHAAAALAERTGVARHDVAVVLGSGWKPAADRFGEVTAEVALDELPGFPPSTRLIPACAQNPAGLKPLPRTVDCDGMSSVQERGHLMLP